MFAPRWQEFVRVVQRHLLRTIESDYANPLNPRITYIFDVCLRC